MNEIDSKFLQQNQREKKEGTARNVASTDKFDRTQYPWITDETLKVKNIFLFLHNEILDFVNFIKPTTSDVEARTQVVQKIKKVVHGVYPDAQVVVFGSCATELNLPNSDIDLLVYNMTAREQSMISKLTSALILAELPRSIEPLKNAKVPIIKMQDKKTMINIDISFNRTNGVHCVKLVKSLMEKYPELKPLLFILKAFLKSR